MSWLWPAVALTQTLAIPGQNPLTDIEEIELVYADTQSIPKIIVRGRQSANSFVLSSYRPSGGRHDILGQAGVGQAVAACQVTHVAVGPSHQVQIAHHDTAPCGVRWSLQRENTSLDALSFRTLRLRGTASSPVTMELVEGMTEPHRAHTIAPHLTGRFTLEIPLAPLAQHLDLRHLTQLRILTDTDTVVVIDEFAFVGPESDAHPIPSIGFWYWDYRAAIRDPEGMVTACQTHHCRRILLQLPDIRDPDQTWVAYARLFPLAQSAGIELFALDGAPDMIDHAMPLIEKLNRLLTVAGDRNVPGVQLDIEPYLLEGFPQDETILQRYLDTLDRVTRSLHERTKVSAVIPFWFASTSHRGRPVAFSVMDRVDEVAVMSYRTDLEELLAIGDDILRYGVIRQMPVWLALETTSLPPEQHVILKRERRAALADGTLDPIRRTLSLAAPLAEDFAEEDRIWFRIHHRTTVRPERVSFSGRTADDVRRMVTDLFARIPYSSFAGLVIHDLPGYLSLRQ